MFEEFQSAISPVLAAFGDNPYIQALVAVTLSFIVAWLFNRVIIRGLKKVALNTPFDLDDHIIEFLHAPVFTSILLLGFASATLILSHRALTQHHLFADSVFALIIWVVFFLRSNRIFLTRISKMKKESK